jgi:hypothetical protein
MGIFGDITVARLAEPRDLIKQGESEPRPWWTDRSPTYCMSFAGTCRFQTAAEMATVMEDPMLDQRFRTAVAIAMS